jgi:hypothetical protein
MSGCEHESLIYSVTEYWNLCQYGTRVSVSSGIMLKNNMYFSGMKELWLMFSSFLI